MSYQIPDLEWFGLGYLGLALCRRLVYASGAHWNKLQYIHNLSFRVCPGLCAYLMQIKLFGFGLQVPHQALSKKSSRRQRTPPMVLADLTDGVGTNVPEVPGPETPRIHSDSRWVKNYRYLSYRSSHLFILGDDDYIPCSGYGGFILPFSWLATTLNPLLRFSCMLISHSLHRSGCFYFRSYSVSVKCAVDSVQRL